MCSIGRPAEAGPSRSLLRTDGRVLEWDQAPSGHVTFVPAGMPMEWEWTYHSESIHLVLPPEFFAGVQSQLGESGPAGAEPLPLFRQSLESIRRVLQQLKGEASRDGGGETLALSSLATLAAVEVLRAMAPAEILPVRGPEALSKVELRRAVDLIESRLGEKVTLSALAHACGLSPFHFARAFKGAVGYPPHEYQLRRRIERAQELLIARPRMTVTEVAMELGFADESHLRRHFRRIVGTTPGRFRR